MDDTLPECRTIEYPQNGNYYKPRARYLSIDPVESKEVRTGHKKDIVEMYLYLDVNAERSDIISVSYRTDPKNVKVHLKI